MSTQEVERVVSMYGFPVFDEVSVGVFRYGDPGDDSLDLQINYVHIRTASSSIYVLAPYMELSVVLV